MSLVRTSPRTKLVRLLFVLAPGWGLAQYWWLSGNPLWLPPLNELVPLGLLLEAVVIPLAVRASRGRRGSEWFLAFGALIWVFFACLSAIFRTSAFGALIALGGALHWMLSLWLLRDEQRRAYSNPNAMWWSSLPNMVPNLQVQFDPETGVTSARISAIDRHGLTFFSAERFPVEALSKSREIGFSLHLPSGVVKLNGVIHQISDGGRVVGVRFSRNSEFDLKKLCDGCGLLAGRGYAGVVV